MQFDYSSTFPVPVEELFRYHESPSALERLIPPQENVVIKVRSSSIQPGQKVVIRMSLMPGVAIDWHAEHLDYEAPTLFSDVQRSGPFHSWFHRHRFEAISSNQSRLTDSVEYSASRFKLVEMLSNSFVRGKIESMFAYRHRVTAADLELAKLLNAEGKRIIVSGASGFLGKRIIAIAQAIGLQVIVLKRVSSPEQVDHFQSSESMASRGVIESPWHVESGSIRVADWGSVDAFIHLAGASIAGKRWTKQYKAMLRSSRVDATKKLVQYLITNVCLPKSMTTASGIGYYASSADKMLAESIPSGNDFLGDLAKNWENASKISELHGTRWCAARLGMVLDPQHGALVPLLRQWKLFAGGKIGDGKMYWSWIERDDAARAFLWLACKEHCEGAYNLSGEALTNRDFAMSLSKVLHRHALIPAPAFAVRLALGEMADALLLRSNRADNSRLLQSGFPMQHPHLESALLHLLR